jgi:D-inositol-3-phosphate glycosyltransferase
VNIVHVSIGTLPPVFDSQGGAIQRRVGELALAQARHGHRVEVFSPGEHTAMRRVGGIATNYLRLRSPRPLSYLEYQVRVVTELCRRRARPDVLHFHSEPEGAVTSLPLRSPTVLSYDNFYFRGGRRVPLFPLYRRVLHRFDALLPCSEYCAAASAAYWALPSDRISVVYNGVNLEQFRPDPEAAERERRRLKINGKVVLYLGRVCEQKGTDTLLSAFRRLRSFDPTIQLLIAGPLEQFLGNPSVSEWPQSIAASGARYLGRVPDERLPGLMTLADVFVMPTRNLEMFGMAAVEAQACGTPVVASDHGGLRETVGADTGLRFRPGDSQQLADCLMTLLGDEARRRQLASAARQRAARFAWENIVHQLDRVYHSVRSQDTGRPSD